VPAQGRLDKQEKKYAKGQVGAAFWLVLICGVVAGALSMFVFHTSGWTSSPVAPAGHLTRMFLVYGFPGYAPFVALYAILRYAQSAALKKAVKEVLGFDPTEQNHADGVIFSFYELRLTRTELIRGYGAGTPRIPLYGLAATFRDSGSASGRVHIRIKGPDTEFEYSMADTVLGGTTRDAKQFARLLNYEADLVGPPPKKVEQKPPIRSATVRCHHCEHVQTVPVSQKMFPCEQCNAHLKRRTAPGESS
jgi:hypothetical protein